MTKLKNLILLFALLMLTAFVQADSISISIEDGAPIYVIKTSGQSGVNRSDSMLASIDGQILTITFTEPLGRVTIIIEDSSGAPVEFEHGETPNGFMYYITTPGTYTLRIILSDGDEYAGVFQVTE